MTALPEALSELVETAVGSSVKDCRSASGGCISQAAVLVCVDGSRYFVKWNYSAPRGLFAAEAEGLNALRETGAIKVPEVVLVCESSDEQPTAILMEALEPAASRTLADSAELGRALAELHRVHAERFGFHIDNFIGELPQINSKADSWGEFFLNNRIDYQAQIGRERGWFSDECSQLLKQKRERISDALNEHSPVPCLLHGDLWSGNVFWAVAGPALIDPAVYFGCREADIGMTQCFGRFDARFYGAYEESFPLEAGHEHRIEILNLYHLMTHANMFGAGYVASAVQRLRTI